MDNQNNLDKLILIFVLITIIGMIGVLTLTQVPPYQMIFIPF